MEDEEREGDAYRDGKVHVMSEKCSTCVFRPGNLMHLQEGRLRQMISECLVEQTAFSCHQSLPTNTYEVEGEALCAGLYEAHGKKIWRLRLAESLGVMKFQEPPTEKRQPK